MKCSEVREFLSEVNYLKQPISPIPPADLGYLSANGYVMSTSKEDYDKGVAEVSRLSQLAMDVAAEKPQAEIAESAVGQDQDRQHSFKFHFAPKDEKEAMQEKIQAETATAAEESAKLTQMEGNLNALLQEKSLIDRMAAYGGGYISLTTLGTVILNDLDVRNYRVADEEFPDFVNENKAMYAELRSIANRASFYVPLIRAKLPEIADKEHPLELEPEWGTPLLWGTALGLGKLQGDPQQIGQRVVQAIDLIHGLHSTTTNSLMAAEILTALASPEVASLEKVLKSLDEEIRKHGVPKELSAGVAATVMAGRRYDGTYPVDNLIKFTQITSSYDAAAILGVMNLPYDDLVIKFESFRALFSSWGFMKSEDTEISSAFLAIGELDADEVQEKLKSVLEQLRTYLEYPLVAAAVLSSIPVFESHEVLDLMEKAVTLLSSYVGGLERSQVVALAVRMIHGVRNEIVKELDSTASLTDTPVQFTYGPYPGFFWWNFPVIVAHSSYNATFSGMGGFHPAHSHGIGGFAG